MKNLFAVFAVTYTKAIQRPKNAHSAVRPLLNLLNRQAIKAGQRNTL